MEKDVRKQKTSKMLFFTLAFIGLNATAKAQSTFSDFTQRNELKITTEMAKEVEKRICMFLNNVPEEMLNNYGVNNRSQLLNPQLGNPIPMYIIENQDLKFLGSWRLPILSNNEFIALATVKFTDNDQCEVVDFGAAELAKIIGNYEHKDLIMGILRVFKQNTDYLYIQKDNKDVFVKMSDLKGEEYSLKDIINLIK